MRFVFALLALGAGSAASAAVVPFTETFTSGTSNWSAPAAWDPTGGPAGTGSIFADSNVNNAVTGVVIALRGQGSSNASGGAFIGDWITQGVTAFSFKIRHNAPEPLTIGARFALASNFPAAIGLQFAPVMPNVWSTVTIPIDPSNPGFVSFEGSSFSTIFSAVANVQLLYSVSGNLAGTGTIVRLEADDVSIVPTPGVATLGLIALAGAARRRHR